MPTENEVLKHRSGRIGKIRNLPEVAPRVIKIDNSSLGIIPYDIDNGYPQRMETIINACSPAKSAVNILTDFTVGQGFVEKSFYDAIINDDGLTPDLLLRLLSGSKSRFRGYAFHVNYNSLYQISSLEFIKFETVRIGFAKNEGKLCIHRNWYDTDTFGSYRRADDVVVIDRFDMRPEIIQAQVDLAGGWESYKGQIYYHSDDYKYYPLSSIDEVLESCIADIESDKTTTNNLKNNFQLKTIWIEKGKFEDDNERLEHTNEVQKFVGPEGNPVVIVESSDPDGKDIPELIEFKSAVNDKLFQYTDEKVRAKIYRAFRQPAILHSDYLGTNGYNEGQLPQSVEYYNNYTQPIRIHFESLFKKIFDNFHETINPIGDYTIQPLANVKTTENKDAGTTTNI